MAPKAKPSAAQAANAKVAPAADDNTASTSAEDASRAGPKLLWSAPLATAGASPRCDFVSAIRDGKLWVVGGWSGSRVGSTQIVAPTVQCFDFATSSWAVLPIAGVDAAHPGLGHTSGAYVEGQGLVLFGGWSGAARVNATTLLVTDGATVARWQAVSTIGDRPPGLSFHSCVSVGKKLVVFGGNSADGQSSETYILDTSSWGWSTVPSSLGAPPRRSSHTATVIHDNLMVVIGGRGAAGDASGGQVLGDVAVFDTSSGHWMIGLRVNGQLPPRYGHAAAAVGHHIIVFGGVGEQGQLLNDTWVLNCEKPQNMTWSKASVGTPLTARAGHSMVDAMNGVYCFGGRLDVLGNIVASDVTHVDTSALAPSGGLVGLGSVVLDGHDELGASPTPGTDM